MSVFPKAMKLRTVINMTKANIVIVSKSNNIIFTLKSIKLLT